MTRVVVGTDASEPSQRALTCVTHAPCPVVVVRPS